MGVLMTWDDWNRVIHFTPNENWGDWTKIEKNVIFGINKKDNKENSFTMLFSNNKQENIGKIFSLDYKES